MMKYTKRYDEEFINYFINLSNKIYKGETVTFTGSTNYNSDGSIKDTYTPTNVILIVDKHTNIKSVCPLFVQTKEEIIEQINKGLNIIITDNNELIEFYMESKYAILLYGSRLIEYNDIHYIDKFNKYMEVIKNGN